MKRRRSFTSIQTFHTHKHAKAIAHLNSKSVPPHEPVHVGGVDKSDHVSKG